MKFGKWITIVAALFVLTCMAVDLTACGQAGAASSEAPAVEAGFASGTTINGQDVSLLTAAESVDYLQKQADQYTLTVTVGDLGEATLTGVKANTDEAAVQALLDQQTADPTQKTFTIDGLYSADMTPLRTELEGLNDRLHEESAALVAEQMSQPEEEAATEGEAEGSTEEQTPAIPDPYDPQDAQLVYDADAHSYVIKPDAYGRYVNVATVLSRAEEAVAALEPELKLEESDYAEAAKRRADAPEMEAALKEANSYLDMELSYTFTPKGGSTSTVTLTKDVIASLLMVNQDSLTVEVNEELLGSYVADLASTYKGASSSTPFKTTGGSTININVTSAGQSVDAQALCADLLSCLQSKTSGTREAPYAKVSDSSEGFWGGNYVEIDLTNQKLWCYKNNKLVISCSVVSGCVANGTTTPTGCFTIFAKDYDRYLKGTNIDGSTYNSHVWYFMPFSGGCGIHDAGWRSNFGGDIYLYSGSHGCVGVTKSQAKTIYENVSVGTHVVVYGGKTSVEPVAQKLSASIGSLSVGQSAKISLSGNKTTATFSSSDTKVATVDANGNVKAVGEGTATITIKCPANKRYKEASTTVTVTVAHVHDWVAKTSTVHHDAVTHEETVTVVDEEAWDETVIVYTVGGVEFSTREAAEAYAQENEIPAEEIVEVEKTIHHDAETHTETKTVVDKEAYDETVTTYVCSVCGEPKP